MTPGGLERRASRAKPTPSRDFGWQMKPLASAKTNIVKLPDGRLELTIEHDTVRGVSPEMLLWWFSNIGGTMAYGDSVYPRYLVWHPHDHIRWELVREAPGGGAAVGARFRIVEAFGRNPDYFVDSTDTVEKLDKTGIRLCAYLLGDRVLDLEHKFAPVPGGTRYDSRMVVGSSSLWGRLFFNRFVRPRVFTDEMGPAWLKHNVEEVGNFEFFLPNLYRHRLSLDPNAE
jgi:hypothetical protein